MAKIHSRQEELTEAAKSADPSSGSGFVVAALPAASSPLCIAQAWR